MKTRTQEVLSKLLNITPRSSRCPRLGQFKITWWSQNPSTTFYYFIKINFILHI